MSNQLGKVRMDTVAACMTCSLCSKLFEEATTISICLHTFCRNCIYERLSDDECDSCPVCEVNLGCNPVDKLRPDHNLQDIRAKLFPIKIQIMEAPEAVPSVSPPVAKRKERSLSSLVVDTPRVPIQASMTGRKTRAKKNSARNKSNPDSEELSEKEEEGLEDENDEELSSPETLNKILQNKKQPSASVKPSNSQVPVEGSEHNKEQWDGKVDLWKPLNCLVEAANRTKFSKSNSQGPLHVKAESPQASDSLIVNSKADGEENGHWQEVQNDKNSTPTTVPGPTKRKNRVRASKKNSTSAPGDASIPPQFVLEAVNHLRRDVPIWFSLVASREQDVSDPLPQIPASFLRIKNGDMLVSSIQKYIAKKLDLPNDTEVEIMCQGQSVLPSLKLRSLLELWLTTATNPAKRIRTYVGSSGKDYVMVLTYSRRVQALPHETGIEPLVKAEPQTLEKEQPFHHVGNITSTTSTTTSIKQTS